MTERDVCESSILSDIYNLNDITEHFWRRGRVVMALVSGNEIVLEKGHYYTSGAILVGSSPTVFIIFCIFAVGATNLPALDYISCPIVNRNASSFVLPLRRRLRQR